MSCARLILSSTITWVYGIPSSSKRTTIGTSSQTLGTRCQVGSRHQSRRVAINECPQPLPKETKTALGAVLHWRVHTCVIQSSREWLNPFGLKAFNASGIDLDT
eukprot:2048981-Amphidinium_carterae.1